MCRTQLNFGLEKDTGQTERWVAAGLIETEQGFRRIKGYQQLPILVAVLMSERRQTSHVA